MHVQHHRVEILGRRVQGAMKDLEDEASVYSREAGVRPEQGLGSASFSEETLIVLAECT